MTMAGFWNGAASAGDRPHARVSALLPGDGGPINGWIYGPISSVAYVPAAWWGHAGVMISVRRAG